ncbi:FAD-dependent oxidoreductase [Olsenella urininfantis]|uniref:FAD-dependent oxidoreductase n=1 Tax=Olsenella urininfantis TaxID=1871033 RepID=UPI000984F1CC|nr:FAD-dependent oxidoreductase [Olsenella urininfantis]
MAEADNLYDAVIVGGGPAGLTAALYLARARYRVLVVEKDRFGGQITITNEVVNYPGVLSASGAEITETMRRQAEAFGAEFMLATVESLDVSGEVKQVKSSKGTLSCHAILLATGASPRRVGFVGEDEFKGHGVAYCATCDGEFFTGKDVFVIGGGFAAAEESVFLTKYARKVTILVREADFSCAPAASEGAKSHEKIEVLYNSEVTSVEGDSALRKISWRNNRTGEESWHVAEEGETFGVFVQAGYVPATALAQGVAELSPQGYIITDENHMSSAEGLFAAGDVCVKRLRQVATAVGEAAAAATDVERYVKAAQERTGLVPQAPVTRLPKTPVAQPEPKGTSSSALFDDATVAQLQTVFSRLESNLVLRLHLDERPVSQELSAYMEELASHSDKLLVERADASVDEASELPFVELMRMDGTPLGMGFHGVPGGHEFTSFVLGIYNAAGPGQPIDEEDRRAIASLDAPVSLKVLVGLSCTMCPEVVLAAQRIAADNPRVSAQVYDINHFPQLREKYDVMSVPCLVVDDGSGRERVSFGRKGLSEVLDLIK